LRGIYRLPQELRANLAKPLGRVFTGVESSGVEFGRIVREASMLVTVGDRVTETLGELGRVPEVQIIDAMEGRVKREPPDVSFSRLVRVRNPAGTISQDAIQGVRKAFDGKKPVRVEVEGEEDLMAMLAIVMAPESAAIFYGQPGVGIVLVEANARSKSRSRAILRKMGIRELAPSS
jgi:uncharacterized protein (UPF0218 family)